MLLNNFRSFRFQTAQKNVTKYSQQKILNDNIYFLNYIFLSKTSLPKLFHHLQTIISKTISVPAHYKQKDQHTGCGLRFKTNLKTQHE